MDHSAHDGRRFVDSNVNLVVLKSVQTTDFTCTCVTDQDRGVK